MRKTLVIVVLVLCLAGCSRPETAMRESHSASLPAAAPIVPALPASEAASDTPASAEQLPSKAERVVWQNDMDALCAAAAPSLRIAHFDVDGNDTADTICWRVLKTKDYGDLIDLQARVATAGKIQTAYIIIPFGGGKQYGICGPAEAIVAEQGRWTKQDFEEMGWDYIGPISISLSGGDCDPPWLFWPKGETGDVVEFIFARA